MSSIPILKLIEYALVAGAAYTLFGNNFSSYLSYPSMSSRPGHHAIDISLLQDDLLLPASNLSCAPHAYTTSLISRTPLIIYIHDFLSPSELSQLLSLAETSGYETSPIYSNSDSEKKEVDTAIRRSARSKLPSSETLTQCLAHRALSFQGYPSDTFVEPLWAQKYEEGGHYAHHFDWAGSVGARGGGRVSTFMVYLGCEGCVGGGTEFPRIPPPFLSDSSDFWCDVVDCNNKEATVFKPVAGSAIYWENVDAEGNSYDSLWHAGLPVQKGTKIGLNVWSWYQPGLQKASSNGKHDSTLREDQV